MQADAPTQHDLATVLQAISKHFVTEVVAEVWSAQQRASLLHSKGLTLLCSPCRRQKLLRQHQMGDKDLRKDAPLPSTWLG